MSDPQRNDGDARRRIDAHLDAVERRLMATDMPRGQRRGIVDDLEAQIIDMLGGADLSRASAADVDRVLRQLDPPEAYGTAALNEPTSTPPRPRVPMDRWFMVGSTMVAVALLCALCRRSESFRTNSDDGLTGVAVVCLLVAVGALGVATVRGWATILRQRRSTGPRVDDRTAVAAAAGLPVLAIWMVTYMAWVFCWMFFVVEVARRDLFPRPLVTFVALAGWIAIASVLSWAFVRRVSRFARSTPTPRSANPGGPTVAPA